MTKPLTPPDCDLQDFTFMPLQVARLRDSDLAATAHPEACWYAVLLWAASWHQLPAASLPDDDAVLARLCGLGRDVRTFRRHKEAALHRFVKCDDGRLYHPVVAEQAVTAWEGKLQQRWRTECARVKKANQRNGTDDPTPTYEAFLASLSPAQADPCPRSVPEDSEECPAGHSVQEKGTGTGRLEEDATASIAETAAKPKPPKSSAKHTEIVETLWRLQPVTGGKRKATRPDVTTALKAALDRGGEPAEIEAAFRAYYALPDCCRDEGRFAMGAAVLLNVDRWRDFLPATATATALAFAGPAELRAAAVAAKDEDFATSYLDPCGWQEVPRKALIPRTSFALDKLRGAIGWMLDREGIELTLAPSGRAVA